MLIDYEVNCPRPCKDCRHYISGVKCLAFSVIPPDFIGDAEAHNTVQDGQQGDYTFVPTKEAETIRIYTHED